MIALMLAPGQKWYHAFYRLTTSKLTFVLEHDLCFAKTTINRMILRAAAKLYERITTYPNAVRNPLTNGA